MQYDIQGDPTMTLKQTPLVTTDVAKLARFNGFFGTPQRLRSFGWCPHAAGLGGHSA